MEKESSETKKIEITEHAFNRAKERLGLKRLSFEKLAQSAFEKGKTRAECKGRLKRYADKLWLSHKKCNNIKFYNQIVFFFTNEKLVTVYQCPKEFHNHLKI